MGDTSRAPSTFVVLEADGDDGSPSFPNFVTVDGVDVHRTADGALQYLIVVEKAGLRWRISRRYSAFRALFEALAPKEAALVEHFPPKLTALFGLRRRAATQQELDDRYLWLCVFVSTLAARFAVLRPASKARVAAFLDPGERATAARPAAEAGVAAAVAVAQRVTDPDASAALRGHRSGSLVSVTLSDSRDNSCDYSCGNGNGGSSGDSSFHSCISSLDGAASSLSQVGQQEQQQNLGAAHQRSRSVVQDGAFISMVSAAHAIAGSVGARAEAPTVAERLGLNISIQLGERSAYAREATQRSSSCSSSHAGDGGGGRQQLLGSCFGGGASPAVYAVWVITDKHSIIVHKRFSDFWRFRRSLPVGLLANPVRHRRGEGKGGGGGGGGAAAQFSDEFWLPPRAFTFLGRPIGRSARRASDPALRAAAFTGLLHALVERGAFAELDAFLCGTKGGDAVPSGCSGGSGGKVDAVGTSFCEPEPASADTSSTLRAAEGSESESGEGGEGGHGHKRSVSDGG
jgi:hypothetical protein